MCRLAAYLGPEIHLGRFILEPEHNLQVQAWGPREMEEARMNADGFGFGWYRNGQPGKYVNTCPMWSDINLDSLCGSLSSGACLANVRSATPGQAVSLDNTQPFISDRFMYLHNGFIKQFGEKVKSNFHASLSPAVQAGIQGNTDSEYLFALFRQELAAAGSDPVEALGGLLAALPSLLDGATALVNLVICDGHRLLACRRAFNNGNCPSLYFTDRHPDFPDAVLIASERLSMPDAWEAVGENSTLLIARGKPVEYPAL
ncbi:MAG: class II glutamine amidotransferase [Gammaproteobacteria bacterium]